MLGRGEEGGDQGRWSSLGMWRAWRMREATTTSMAHGRDGKGNILIFTQHRGDD